MTIQELGSLGELVGAIAVLATLVYLSLQTRQARIAAEETAKYSGLQATHSMLDLYFDWRRTLFSDPAHREIIAKANEGEELTNSERFTVGLIFHDLFFAAAYSNLSAASGGSIHEEEADVEYIVWVLRENPCAVPEWNRTKSMVARMDRNFVMQVDRELEAGDA
jgi:hypothetical protein